MNKTILWLMVLMILVQSGIGYSEVFTLDYNDIAADGYVGIGHTWFPDADYFRASFTETRIQSTGFPWSWYSAGLLRFDLSGVPASSYVSVVKAELILHCTYVSQSNPVGPTAVYRSKANWNTNATWNTADGTTPWMTAGSNVCSARDEDSVAGKLVTLPGPVTWDVTQIVQDWLFDGKPNYGFQIQSFVEVSGVPGIDYPDVYFASSRTDLRALTPTLKITLGHSQVSLPHPVQDTPRPTAPYRVWYGPAFFAIHPELYSNMTLESQGVADRMELYLQGRCGLTWAYGLQTEWNSSDDPNYWYNYCKRRVELVAIPEDPNTYVGLRTVGSSFDEWANPYKTNYESLAAEGLRDLRADDPNVFITVWATNATATLIQLALEGTIDLIVLECYTFSPVSHGNQTVTWSDIISRCDTVHAGGVENKSIVAFGVISGEQNGSGQYLTTSELTTMVANIKSLYPEMPGVAFYQSSAPDTQLSRDLTAHCDTLSLQYYPGSPVVNHQCGDLGTQYYKADILGPQSKPDCYVNMYDLAAVAADWLK
jgi:hypothetical protein